MTWIDATLDELAAQQQWSYRANTVAATEPTALAALALVAHGRNEAAERALRWLAKAQTEEGCLGISAEEKSPHWPTGWAVLAWSAAMRAGQTSGAIDYRAHISRAIRWMLTIEGKPNPRTKELGHDTTLIGWPWVESTHSWLEPTALNVLALKANGNGDHSRAREAVQLLIDRLLPDGGCNYGNTSVLGQVLRPQLEPSGLALVALVGETDPSGRLEKTIRWIESTLSSDTTAASLGYGLIGLAAHGRFPKQAPDWLESAAERTKKLVGSQPRLALLALAAKGAECPIVKLTRQVPAS
jgi:hypothetical protein